MRKIPTLFRRDPDDMKRVLPEINPECQWVIDGHGEPTRKYDGTCVMLDEDGTWWARREVKAGKATPPGYRPVMTDPATGKTVGWEPVGQSAFAKFHAQAVEGDGGWEPGTFEMVGPKVNGNPEGVGEHMLVRHSTADRLDAPRDYDGLREWLLAHPQYEGIVWHYPQPDGTVLMAKLKRRDFA